jgi:hypothetical protein
VGIGVNGGKEWGIGGGGRYEIGGGGTEQRIIDSGD